MNHQVTFSRSILPTLLVCLCVGFCDTVAAAEKIIKIGKIVIQPRGTYEVREDLVRSQIKYQEGDKFTQQGLARDIKRLYECQYFADIQVDVFPMATGDVRLVYMVQAKVRLQKIVFYGCDQISAKKLKKEMVLEEREVFQEGKLSTDLAAFHKKYEEKGYYGTRIRYYLVDSIRFAKLAQTHREKLSLIDEEESTQLLLDNPEFFGEFKTLLDQPFDSGKVHLVLWIEENKRYLIRGVNLVGAESISLRKLKKTHPLHTSYAFFSGYVSNEQLKQDADQIRKWYWDNGHFDADLKAVSKEFGKTSILRRRQVEIDFVIDEGPAYEISTINFIGNERFTREELERLIKFEVGQVYSKKREKLSLERMRKKYFRLGYLDLNMTTQLDPDPDTNTVIVNFNINEGQPASIRDIYISGNDITKDNVIRRELSVKPGEPGDRGEIDSSKNRLKGLGYFESVETMITDTQDKEWKDLHVRVQEGRTAQIAATASISDADSALFGVELRQSNFDIFGWDNGFRGGGQRIRAAANVGDSQNNYSLSFTEPWLFNRRLRYDLDAWRRFSGVYGSYDKKSTGEQMKLTKKLPFRFWRAYFGHKYEEIKISDVDVDFSPEFIAHEEGISRVSAFLGGLIRDSRNDSIFPSSGSRVQFTGEYQSDAIGSYTDLYKLNLRADKYFPIFKDSVIRFSGRAGQVNQFHGETDARIFDRYYAGGIGSVRGFKSRDIGPVDPMNGEPIAGKSIMVYSTEVLKPLFEEMLYGAVWVDAGNVWAGSWDWKFDDLNVGAGFGIRIRMPIGATLSLDYGWPLATQQEHLDGDPEFHFNLGYSF
ncbi:outer membrane protein assembly factor BamA [bacterium M21]|nr:outer membrane protein assembly factor BamA [bacterium M21]